jgi:superfamily II DNA or RNA helicase
LGEVLFEISAADLIKMGYLANLEIQPIEIQEKVEEEFPDYSAEKAYTSKQADRLDFLADLIIDRAAMYGNTLILVNTIKQGQQLQKLIKDSVFLQGSTENEVRAEWYSTFESRDDLIVIATVGIAAVGISIDRVFALFLIDAGKSFVKCIQSIGRGLRKGHDKDFVHVIDVYSGLKYGKKHARERKKHYQEAKYPMVKVIKVKL